MAIDIFAILHAAEGEVSPSYGIGHIACSAARYTACAGFEEPDLVLWVAIDRAGEDDEELQHNAAGEKDDSDEGENRSCRDRIRTLVRW